MKRNEQWRIPGVAYPVVIVVLGLAVAACEDKPSAGNVPPVAASTPQTVQPAAPQIESPKPVDAQKSPESPQAAEDAALAAKIKSVLGAEPALKRSTVDVGVSNGAVTLYGTADTRAHLDKAAQLAASIPGVKSVKNEMVIVAGS